MIGSMPRFSQTETYQLWENIRQNFLTPGAVRGYVPRSPLLDHSKRLEGESDIKLLKRTVREARQEVEQALGKYTQAYISGDITLRELCQIIGEQVEPRRKELEGILQEKDYLMSYLINC